MKGIPADSEKGRALAAEVSGGDEQYFVADGRSPGTSWWKHAKEREALERERDFWRDLWQRTALNAIGLLDKRDAALSDRDEWKRRFETLAVYAITQRAERDQWEKDALDAIGALWRRHYCRHGNRAHDCAYCRECEGAK